MLTWRATFLLLLASRPTLSKTRTVPIGDCVAVAVVTVTLSERAHREERASPRKPNVRTEVRSENEASFDVWCFNAVPKLNTKDLKDDADDDGLPIES